MDVCRRTHTLAIYIELPFRYKLQSILCIRILFEQQIYEKQKTRDKRLYHISKHKGAKLNLNKSSELYQGYFTNSAGI